MNIFLIGFMGSGKSTTGRKLARRLGYEFVDTDKLIVREFGMSINEIFARFGEEVFRQAETSLLEKLVSKDRQVVSTGGGLPCWGNNMDLITRSGTAVYLKVSPPALMRRLSLRKENRPLIRDLNDEELKEFISRSLAEREPYYNKAGIVVRGPDTDLEELAGQLGF